jgi:hypothetical protein
MRQKVIPQIIGRILELINKMMNRKNLKKKIKYLFIPSQAINQKISSNFTNFKTKQDNILFDGIDFHKQHMVCT